MEEHQSQESVEWTGDIAQRHEHLPDKSRVLSSIPGTENKNKNKTQMNGECVVH